MRRFTATLDSLARTITFVVILVLVIPFVTILNQYGKLDDEKLLIGPVIVTIALIITALFRIREYGLDEQGLHIIRPLKPVSFALSSFRSISPVTSKELGLGLRAFGSGGFLGYFGVFFYRNHGRVTLYATDRSKMLLIMLENDRKIIISPDDPEAFLAAFSDLQRSKKATR